MSTAPVSGHYGPYGGRFVPEALTSALDELDAAFRSAIVDPSFIARLTELEHSYTGRPSPLTRADRFAAHCGGARVYLKREDLNHTGSHKINNAIGQALLTQRMGKTRMIAETGAGQHGVATATAAALLGLECTVFMGEEDTRRQALNVVRMQLLGAEVFSVTAGSRTLKDAINEAMRDWVSTVERTHYVLGTVTGPAPFPEIVRYFQSVVGREARKQILETEGRLPDAVVACVGGGSNAMGLFSGFIDDTSVQLRGYEAGGDGVETGRHAARFSAGSPGVLHGTRTYVMQDEWGQTIASHSISAGLDYPGVGPEHSWWKDSKRVEYVSATDTQALDAFQLFSRLEGIIPALETSHAIHGAIEAARAMKRDQVLVINVSGRGDKDVTEVMRLLGQE